MVYIPGPYDRFHGVIQWGGTLPGNEQWCCSLRVAPFPVIDLPGLDTRDSVEAWDVDELIDHYVLAIKAYHNNPLVPISNRAVMQYVKFNRVDLNGRYIDANTNERVFADWSGATNTMAPANQVALAVTTTTAVSRGPGSRGRFYLPMPAITPGGDGLISVQAANDLATATKTFLEAIADVPGLDIASDPSPAVMSRKAGAPVSRKITGCSVGRVLDTQRRRRRSLPELYEVESVDQGTF